MAEGRSQHIGNLCLRHLSTVGEPGLAGHAKEIAMMDTQQARNKLIDDVNTVIADSEQLLKAMASASGEKAQALRVDLERKLAVAREGLDEIQDFAVKRAREAAKEADDYVHESPWQAIGIAAAVAA